MAVLANGCLDLRIACHVTVALILSCLLLALHLIHHFVHSMRVAPSTSASRGEPVLQPTYFTSSVYVSAARDDITTLIHGFHAKHYASPGAEPFATFKTIWLSQGWKWIHFLVFDDRARFSCLNTTMRLFLGKPSLAKSRFFTDVLLERMVKTEAPFTRVVTLLGLYTLLYTQPVAEAPPLLSISHLPIPIGANFLSLSS